MVEMAGKNSVVGTDILLRNFFKFYFVHNIQTCRQTGGTVGAPTTSFSFLMLWNPLPNPRSVEYAKNILKAHFIVQKPVYSIVFHICTQPLPTAPVATATVGTDARPTPNQPIYSGDTYIFSLPARGQLTLCSRLSIGPRAFGGPRFAQNAITTVPRVRISNLQLVLGEAVRAQ